MNTFALIPLEAGDTPGCGALAPLRGSSLLTHCVRGLLRSGQVDRVLIAGPDDLAARYRDAVGRPAVSDPGEQRMPLVDVVAGSTDRTASTRLALSAAEPTAADLVLIHDARRPCTRPETVHAVVDALRGGAAAAVPVSPVTDTVKIADPGGAVLGTRDRDGLRETQAPWGFTAGSLRGADLADPLTTVDAPVHTVAGDPHGMCVRTEFDRTVLDALLAAEEAG